MSPTRCRRNSGRGGHWRNWVGNQSFIARHKAEPGSEDELASLVREASRQNLSVRVAGSGHSFTPIVATSGLLLSLTNMQGLVRADFDRKRVVVPEQETTDIASELPMPRGGAATLADVRAPTLAIACEPCWRRGRYNVERLIAKDGADAKLPDLLASTIAVAITLGAERPRDGVSLIAFFIGVSIAAVANAAIIWIAYRFADRVTAFIGATARLVVVRLSAFLLMCVGVQILVTAVGDLVVKWRVA